MLCTLAQPPHPPLFLIPPVAPPPALLLAACSSAAFPPASHASARPCPPCTPINMCVGNSQAASAAAQRGVSLSEGRAKRKGGSRRAGEGGCSFSEGAGAGAAEGGRSISWRSSLRPATWGAQPDTLATAGSNTGGSARAGSQPAGTASGRSGRAGSAAPQRCRGAGSWRAAGDLAASLAKALHDLHGGGSRMCVGWCKAVQRERMPTSCPYTPNGPRQRPHQAPPPAGTAAHLVVAGHVRDVAQHRHGGRGLEQLVHSGGQVRCLRSGGAPRKWAGGRVGSGGCVRATCLQRLSPAWRPAASLLLNPPPRVR